MPLQKPKYHPKFSKSDLRQVEEVLRRRTAPQVQVQRARLAKLLHSEPKVDNMDAARRLGVALSRILAVVVVHDASSTAACARAVST